MPNLHDGVEPSVGRDALEASPSVPREMGPRGARKGGGVPCHTRSYENPAATSDDVCETCHEDGHHGGRDARHDLRDLDAKEPQDRRPRLTLLRSPARTVPHRRHPSD